MRHFYLTPTGELKRRKTDWRFVGALVGAIIFGLLSGLGLVGLMFLVFGRSL